MRALIGVLLVCANLIAFARSAEPNENVLVRFGPAEATLADVQAGVLGLLYEKRKQFISDPKLIGDLLEKILVRRAIVEDIAPTIDAETRSGVRQQAEAEALVKLGIEYLSTNFDEIAVRKATEEVYDSWKADKGFLYDFTMYTFAYETGDAKSAKERASAFLEAARMKRTLPEFSKESEYTKVSEAQFSQEALALLQAVEVGEFAGPLAGDAGVQVFRLDARRREPVPPLEEVRLQMTEMAKGDLAKNGRVAATETYDEAQLIEQARNAGLDQSAIGKALIRQNYEEALLSVAKEEYLKRSVPAEDELDALAREHYMVNKEDFASPVTLDMAIYEVAFDGPSPLDALDQLGTAVQTGGLDSLKGAIEQLDNATNVKGWVKQGVSAKLLEERVIRAVEQMLASGEEVAEVDSTSAGKMYVAVSKVNTPIIPEFDEIRPVIVEKLVKDLRNYHWQSFTHEYKQYAVDVDEVAMAEIRNTLDSQLLL